MMKMRESGMPEESYWETLLDAEGVLDRLGVDGTLHDVVELGCGYGTFSLPAARRIGGRLSTCDIDPVMVARTVERAQANGITNIHCVVRDVFESGFNVPDASQDAALLFNILHGEEPVRLLSEAARVLRTGGTVLVIHWRRDIPTPRGPGMDIRPRPEDLVAWAGQTSLFQCDGPMLHLPPWHYGFRFRRL